MPLAIDTRGGESKPHLDGMFGIVFRMADQQTVARQSAREEFLGQRRALIGQQSFVANQCDLAAMPATAQGLDRLTTAGRTQKSPCTSKF